MRVHERVREQARTLVHIATAICEALESGGRVRFFDGSAGGDARHWVADLTPRLHGRFAHQLIAPAAASASAGLAPPRFSRVVPQASEGALGGSDVAIGVATGPADESVLSELRRAAEAGAAAVVFTGKREDDETDFCTRAVVIPSADGARVREALVLCRHIVVDLVGEKMGVQRMPAPSADV